MGRVVRLPGMLQHGRRRLFLLWKAKIRLIRMVKPSDLAFAGA
jgi:hypothetical protein